jgi:hypothetical protein
LRGSAEPLAAPLHALMLSSAVLCLSCNDLNSQLI